MLKNTPLFWYHFWIILRYSCKNAPYYWCIFALILLSFALSHSYCAKIAYEWCENYARTHMDGLYFDYCQKGLQKYIRDEMPLLLKIFAHYVEIMRYMDKLHHVMRMLSYIAEKLYRKEVKQYLDKDMAYTEKEFLGEKES